MKQLLSFLISLAILVGMLPMSVLSKGAQEDLTTLGSATDVSLSPNSLYDAPVWSGDTAPYARGDGSAERPYIIETGEQLAYLADMVNYGYDSYHGKFFALANDINLNLTKWTPIGIDGKCFE